MGNTIGTAIRIAGNSEVRAHPMGIAVGIAIGIAIRIAGNSEVRSPP